MLNTGPGATVRLRCGTVPLFEGRVGRRKNRVAVRIEREIVRTLRRKMIGGAAQQSRIGAYPRRLGAAESVTRWQIANQRHRRMAGMEWILEVVLVAAARRDAVPRAAAGTRAGRAEARSRRAGGRWSPASTPAPARRKSGIEQLRVAADGAGRQMARQIDTVVRLKDDLVFLLERGERLADRLDSLVRAGRPLAAEARRPMQVADDDPADLPRVRSQAERDLLKALRMAR